MDKRYDHAIIVSHLPLLPVLLLLLLLLLLQVLVSRLNCSRCVAALKGGCIRTNRVTQLQVTDSSFTYNWVSFHVMADTLSDTDVTGVCVMS
jgi:Kef-type K+ transport system membrane component KefB